MQAPKVTTPVPGRATKSKLLLVITSLLLCGMAGAYVFSSTGRLPGSLRSAPAHISPAPPDRARVQAAIALAEDYLVRACQENGKFIYSVNTDTGIVDDDRYNELRHAGTMYALAMQYEVQPRAATLEALQRAAKFLREQCMAPLPAQPHTLAVWAPPSHSRRRQPRVAKLGGAGLALVALLSLEKIKPGSTPLAELRKLGQFVVYMQKADGSFYSKYSENQRQDNWTSLFYPGEAALGLLMLYEKDLSPLWLDKAALAIAYLARSRQSQQDVPLDHWALLATARLLPLYDKLRNPAPRALIEKHAIQVCHSILKAEKPVQDPALQGCLTGDGRTTPTATRLEGLQAALTFLPPREQALRTRIRQAAHKGINFLLRAQLTSGQFAGGIPGSVGRPKEQQLPADAEESEANLVTTQIRIDYVQHAISAMIQYLQQQQASSGHVTTTGTA